MITIVVEYKAKPGQRAALEEAVRRNAALTLADDGCLRMEVVIPRRDPESVLLNELWRDDAAIAAHRAKPGHDASHEEVDSLTAEKRVVIGDLDAA